MHASRADLPAQVLRRVRGPLRRLGRDPRRDRDHARATSRPTSPRSGACPTTAASARTGATSSRARSRVTYLDGSEERVNAGDVYHLRPGHFVQTLEPTELIEFSPVHEHDKTMSVVMANVFAESAS